MWFRPRRRFRRRSRPAELPISFRPSLHPARQDAGRRSRRASNSIPSRRRAGHPTTWRRPAVRLWRWRCGRARRRYRRVRSAGRRLLRHLPLGWKARSMPAQAWPFPWGARQGRRSHLREPAIRLSLPEDPPTSPAATRRRRRSSSAPGQEEQERRSTHAGCRQACSRSVSAAPALRRAGRVAAGPIERAERSGSQSAACPTARLSSSGSVRAAWSSLSAKATRLVYKSTRSEAGSPKR